MNVWRPFVRLVVIFYVQGYSVFIYVLRVHKSYKIITETERGERERELTDRK